MFLPFVLKISVLCVVHHVSRCQPNTIQMVLSDFNKVVHVLAILSRSTASNFSPEFLLICEHNSLKKSACYRPFKNGHSVRVRTEKMINHQNRENGERKIYSNQNQTEALISLILSKSINKTCLIDNSSSNRPNFVIQ